METNPPTPSSAIPQSLAARIGWLVLILATLYVCYFSHLGVIGFVGPDEPRYAWIARDMAETGDWVTPRLYGKPWFEKPPLYYWGAALSFKLFGVSEAAARLPSAISALFATLALAWLALRLYGAETARWLLLLLPTTVGMIGFSHAAATDMPFSAMLTIAMVAAAVLLGLVPDATSPPAISDTASSSPLPSSPLTFFTRSAFFASVVFGFFLGLAVLAKGPAGIILCGGAVFFWALVTKRWRDALRLLHPAGIVAFFLTALPWYILCARRNPDFFRIFIIEHNFKRFLTPEFQHIQPFWFYAPILCAALLPWSVSFIILAKELLSSRRESSCLNSPSLFFACWVVFPLAFFSLSKSKLPGYILPAILPLGLLLAHGVSLRVNRVSSGGRWTGITAGATLMTLGVLAFVQTDWISLGWTPLILMASGIAIIILASPRRLSSVLLIGVAAIVGVVASTLAGTTGETLDQHLSARPALQAAPVAWNSYSAEHSSTYELQRSFQYSLNFYLHRELPAWSPNLVEPSWVFASGRETGELRSLGLECPLSALRYVVVVCRDPGSMARVSGRREPQ